MSLAEYPVMDDLKGLPLTGNGRRLLSLMANGAVLATTGDIGLLMGCSGKYASSLLDEVVQSEYVRRSSLGWEGGLAGRAWLTDKLREDLDLRYGYCDEPWFLARRLERLPLVEHCYPAVAQVEGLGQIRQIAWHEQLCIDASVYFEHGWVAMLYSGLLETRTDIRERVSLTASQITEYSGGRTDAWPDLFLWIVADRWQAEMVKSVAASFGIQDRFAFYVAADGTYTPSAERFPHSCGYVYQPLSPRDMGGWPWERRLEDSPWGMPDGRVLGQVLDAVLRFPGAWFSLIKAASGGEDKQRVARALKRLRDLRWIESRPLKGKARYSVTGPGYHQAARRDGVSNVGWESWANVPAFRGRPQLQDHEDGVMALFGEFLEAGCQVEPGRRGGDDLGQRRGGIVPDGIVYLARGPYGPGWYYIEYERSARGKARAKRKLTGYLSSSSLSEKHGWLAVAGMMG